MMPGNVFGLQLASAFEDGRRIALRAGINALLAVPFIFVDMPAGAQAKGLVLVIMFTSFFGASVSFARLRSESRLERLTLLPISRGALYLDLVLASVLERFALVLAIVIVFVVINAQTITPAALICLAGFLSGSLLLLTLLGMATAHLARGNGEVHLFGALACAALALVSGLTPLPERLIWLSEIAAFNPISRLFSLLIRLTTGTAAISGTELLVASLIIAAFIIIAVLRWVLGRTGKTEKGLTQCY